MVMEWYFFVLFFLVVRTHVVVEVRTHVVATTVCATGKRTHTHLLHAHVSAHSALTAYFAHLHACHTHAWLKVMEKVFVECASLLFFESPSPFSCFTRLPCCSCTVTSRPTSPTHSSARSCRTFPTQKRGSSALCTRTSSLAIWPSPSSSHSRRHCWTWNSRSLVLTQGFKHALQWMSRQVVCFWESHRMVNLFTDFFHSLPFCVQLDVE